jgi:hypothetical protein
LKTWTPDVVFGAGTYRWTVQSWQTVGFGTVSAPAAFTITAAQSAQQVSPAVAVAVGESAAASSVPMALSGSAVRVIGAGISAIAADAQQEEAAAGTDSAAVEPTSPDISGMYGTAALVVTSDAPVASATPEGAENWDHMGASLPAAGGTDAAGILAEVWYPDSVLPGEEQAASDGGAMSSSVQATDMNSQQVSLQNEESGSDLGQTEETGTDLVSTRGGYIAPIDIIVGPMSDPGAKQASLTAKEIAEKPDNAV